MVLFVRVFFIILVFTARCTMCIARYCYSKSSIRPSVNLSVTLRYRGHISCVTSKIIIQITSLGSSLLEPQHQRSSPKGTPPKFWRNRSRVAVLSRKPAISLKREKTRPRLLLITNRKLHTIGTKINDLACPWTTVTHSFSKYLRFRSPPRKFG